MDNHKIVYELVHIYERGEDDEIKNLGIYSTRRKAEEAIDRYKILEGFNKYPIDCFFINECELDKDAWWTEGFINSEDAKQEFQKFAECFELWLRDLDFKVEADDLLYNLECEVYEGVCSMKNANDIVAHIRKTICKRFPKMKITSKQCEKFISLLASR